MEKIMTKGLPDINLRPPTFFDKLVPLQFQKNILLCPQTHTRWKKTRDGLERDHDGEHGWEEMGNYVNKSYYEVFMDSYRSALQAKDA
jgi:hypothetical protein